MGKKKNDGGQAFPAIATSPMGDLYHQEGMTLRDWLAAKAMAAIISKIELMGVNPPSSSGAASVSDEHRDAIMRCVAVGAYNYADAMLAERDN